jgi:hypothetical protein
MFKFFRKFAANKTSPIPERKFCYQDVIFPHYYATIIQLGWFGSPRYRKRLKKKLKKRRKRDYKHYAAITIQCAWYRSRLYQRLFIKKINALLCRVERLDLKYVDDYIKGIEYLIKL